LKASIECYLTYRLRLSPSHRPAQNRAFDHMLGCMYLPGLDGIPPEGRQIPVDPLNKSAGYVNVTCGSATYICNGTQSYSLWDGKFKNGSQAKAYPYGPQSDGWSVKNGGAKAGESVNMFSAEQLPIKKTLATEFGVFNKFFTSTPTASTPNHLFAQSCTSCGQIGNSLYNTVGGSTAMYPQLTIFDNMELNNVSFGLYMNNTNDPNWPKEYLTPVSVPDVVMSGVARYKDNFYNHSEFSAAAAAGTLPSFSWIMPPAPMMDHPCHDIALGERLHKDIYEALRAGKNWEKTLFLIMCA
jgi:phospholipase C